MARVRRASSSHEIFLVSVRGPHERKSFMHTHTHTHTHTSLTIIVCLRKTKSSTRTGPFRFSLSRVCLCVCVCVCVRGKDMYTCRHAKQVTVMGGVDVGGVRAAAGPMVASLDYRRGPENYDDWPPLLAYGVFFSVERGDVHLQAGTIHEQPCKIDETVYRRPVHLLCLAPGAPFPPPSSFITSVCVCVCVCMSLHAVSYGPIVHGVLGRYAHDTTGQSEYAASGTVEALGTQASPSQHATTVLVRSSLGRAPDIC